MKKSIQNIKPFFGLKKLRSVICFFLLLSASLSFAQNKPDSLLKLLSKKIADTTRINVYNELCWPVYSFSNTDSSILYGEKAVALSMSLNDTVRLITAYRRIGIAYINRADHNMALFYETKSYDLAKAMHYKKGMASALNNLSVIYLNMSDYKRAIEYNIQSQKIQEESKDSSGLFNAYYNTALLFKNIEDLKGSKKFYIKAYKIALSLKQRDQQAHAMMGIGTILKKEKKFESALHYYTQSLEWFKRENHLQGLAEIYINTGSLYSEWGIATNDKSKLQTALKFYSEGLVINKQYDNRQTTANIMGNIAFCYQKLEKHDSTILYALKAIDLANSVGDNSEVVFSANILSEAYFKKGNYPLSIKYLRMHMVMKDSLFNYEKQKDIEQKQMQYDFDKKTIADSLKVVQEKKVTQEKSKREQIVRYGLIVFLLLLVVFSFIMYNRFKLIKQQNNIIQEQKNQVEEKQKEIIDSINYAKRIQHTLLANEELINKYLPKHFVLFKPKDIVSGDFYWAAKKDHYYYLAVCDSTGHGVPGAFMSLLNISFLNEAISEKNFTEPHDILNHVRVRLIENMDGGRDGMDAILMRFEIAPDGKLITSGQIHYAAANNEPILVRGGKILELPKDKMPVGKGEKTDSFRPYTIDMQQNDILYLYTDGFADQFGGPKGKKFKYRQLNDLLLSISLNNISEQQKVLESTFIDWKGNLEQVDDVAIIGIKL